MSTSVSNRRTEMRSRYYTRSEAQRIGWNVHHPERGGRFLEENELIAFFPELRSTLNLDRPDFAILGDDKKPALIVECKANAHEIDRAVQEAQEYADIISCAPGFDVKIATGLAGSPDNRVYTKTKFKVDGEWMELSSHGYPLTQIPTPVELSFALERCDGTTDVQLPDEREFFDAAIQLSNIFRKAKIEEVKRPLVIGAIITALWHNDFLLAPDTVIQNINTNVERAIDKFKGVPADRKKFLLRTLQLGTESESLRIHMERVVNQLERLNVRSIMQSGVDFLGQFYETFLRYGGDSSNLGIVFTPRHITRFCADLIEVDVGDKVYDPACGTGGFLVAAFDRMMNRATTETLRNQVKSSIYGSDTNPTVWALSMLNMFFRGDGKSKIHFKSAFEGEQPIQIYDKALLNPPFSQTEEPEIDFIDHALNSLKTGGLAAIVVKTNVVVDPSLRYWREQLLNFHQVLAVVSLPVDLFYPTSAPTVVMLVRAHMPVRKGKVMLGIIKNDGFQISKKRRVVRDGSELDRMKDAFFKHLHGKTIKSESGFLGFVDIERIRDGGEICAERWLDSKPYTSEEHELQKSALFKQIALAITNYSDAVDVLIPDYNEVLKDCGNTLKNNAVCISDWFIVSNGKSPQGVSKYPGGEFPYISSADPNNSIVGMVQPPENEIYSEPRVTVTAFGQAAIQPWRFVARGNGGSAVRVLEPKIAMSLADLIWLTGQINSQKWRFHYGRMATKLRIESLSVDPPPSSLDHVPDLQQKITQFLMGFNHLIHQDEDAKLFSKFVAEWKDATEVLSSVTQMALHPSYLRIIGMGETAIPLLLEELKRNPDHWFLALNAITGENPVVPNHKGNIKKMTQDWINWGINKGYIEK